MSLYPIISCVISFIYAPVPVYVRTDVIVTWTSASDMPIYIIVIKW